MNEQALLSILSGADRRTTASVLRGALACLAPAYALAAAAKNGVYDLGLATAHDLGRPTVSIGNLTTGGTGKTPMVAWVVRQLAAAGHRPCVLLRGYRARDGKSDEAEELRVLVGDVAQVAPNPNRVAEAARMLAAHSEISCFVLDDGFQHRRAGRNLDLALVDATNPWGYGATLPRGLMREKKSGLRRADAVVVTRCDRVSAPELARVAAEIQAVTGHSPLALAKHGWDGFAVWRPEGESEVLPSSLANERVVAACGIGNPAAFLTQAGERAGAVVWTCERADHFAWDAAALTDLFAQAQSQGASSVLTTEKDFVKWRPLLAKLRPGLPVFRPRLSMQFVQGQEALATLLASRIPLTPIGASR